METKQTQFIIFKLCLYGVNARPYHYQRNFYEKNVHQHTFAQLKTWAEDETRVKNVNVKFLFLSLFK